MSSSSKRDYYEILGVSRTATADEIKKAYRKIALANHPDRNQNNTKAEEVFKEASEAYEILSNPEKRAQYDQFGHQAFSGGAGSASSQGFGDMEDIFGDVFSSLFGGHFGQKKKSRKGPSPQRGADLVKEVSVTLKESYTGSKKEISFNHYLQCSQCHGGGCAKNTSPTACSTCKGMGNLVMQQGLFSFTRPCTACQGQGFVITTPCPTCKGQCRVRSQENLVVNIIPGIFDGAQMRLSGKGDAGIFGGESGDLFLKINVLPTKGFSRREDDLVTTLFLTYPQLVFGCQVEVELLDGTREIIRVSPGTQVGSEITIAGKGFARLQGKGKGKLIILIQCSIPTSLPAEASKALHVYAEHLGEVPSQESGGITGFFKRFLK